MLHIGTRIASAHSRHRTPIPWIGWEFSFIPSSMLPGTAGEAASRQGKLRCDFRTMNVTLRPGNGTDTVSRICNADAL
jgi:hypothetical protein